MAKESQLHHSFGAKDLDPVKGFQLGKDYALDSAADISAIQSVLGIGASAKAIRGMQEAFAMDAIQGVITTAAVPNPVQFYQNWLPGVVSTVSAARKADQIVGIATMGSWADEEIVQRVVEPTGTPVPYSDTGVVPFANWNLNFVYRTVIRFELGMRVGNLEQERAARTLIDSAGEKRTSAALQLDVQRNATAFYGYNSGNGLTYGMMNDPNLPAYVNVATGTWATKNFLQIQTDILTAIQALRTQSQEVIDPNQTPLCLTVAANAVDYLSKTSDFGISVKAWMNMTYPNIRLESAVQLNAANGGAGVFYLFADTVNDGLSTDDQKTFIQVVPAKFQITGVSQQTKGYEEDYVNATAGTMVKRPYAVVRYSGIS